jgi:hypothetical protein
MPDWIFPLLAIVWAVVSTIVAWIFATGRVAGTANQQLYDLIRRVQGEHDERKRLVEQINLHLGQLQVSDAEQAGRIRAIEEDVKELRRKVFNGSLGGVA